MRQDQRDPAITYRRLEGRIGRDTRLPTWPGTAKVSPLQALVGNGLLRESTEGLHRPIGCAHVSRELRSSSLLSTVLRGIRSASSSHAHLTRRCRFAKFRERGDMRTPHPDHRRRRGDYSRPKTSRRRRHPDQATVSHKP